MKREKLNQLIIIILMLGAVLAGALLIWFRWPTSCIKYDTTAESTTGQTIG